MPLGLRTRMQKSVVLYCAVLLHLCLPSNKATAAEPRLNVLLVLVDDLRVELGAYGSKFVETPNMDNFAQDSVVFENAYSSLALCGPSRLTLLTGREPHELNYYQHLTRSEERQAFTSSLSLPQYFERHGYRTYGTSKIAHFVTTNNDIFQNYDNLPVTLGSGCDGHAVCETDSGWGTTDFQALRRVRSKLQDFQSSSRNWFLTVGFRRPHFPFRVPDYIMEQVSANQPLPESHLRLIPPQAPWQAHHPMCNDLASSHEVRSSNFDEERDRFLSDEVSQRLRRGYFASVAWIDRLMGHLLNDVDMSNTLVVITSDHGWQLGEHGAWCKGSLYDLTLRVPLMIRDPRGSNGRRVSQVVGHSQLYSTIAELAGIPISAQDQENFHMNPTSYANLVRPNQPTPQAVVDLMEKAEIEAGNDWSYPLDAAFSVWAVCIEEPVYEEKANCRICYDKRTKQEVSCGGCIEDTNCDIRMAPIYYMGFSVRSASFRYVQWRKWDHDDEVPDWSSAGLVAQQLFDHSSRSGQQEVDDMSYARSSSNTISRYSSMLRAKFLKCSTASTFSACRVAGDHCTFFKGSCISRSTCKFSSQSDCLARSESCQWRDGACLNRVTYRDITVPVEPTQSPTKKPTKSPTPIPTESPTAEPTPKSTLPSRICSTNLETTWGQMQDYSRTCLSSLSSQMQPFKRQLDPIQFCESLTPTGNGPNRRRAFNRWKRRSARKCTKHPGCQWLPGVLRCAFNACENRNDGSCTLEATDGKCVWYDHHTIGLVRNDDRKILSGCYTNVCSMATSRSECNKSGDSQVKCSWCPKTQTCQGSFEEDPTKITCKPCGNALECYESLSCAKGIKRDLNRCRPQFIKRLGRYKTCSCLLKDCPNAHPFGAPVAACVRRP